jgi:hypothetical protein
VQDDDLIPRENGWLDAALGYFDGHPELAILGGFQGYGSFDPDPAKAKRIWGGDEFRFVHHVNIGPYFVRRQHYELLGGWDYSFSEVGEPGICADNELCLRAWVNGYQVGYRFVPFKGPSGHYPADGGTVLFSNDTRVRNAGNLATKHLSGASGLSEHVGATADRVIVVTYGVIDADACIEARASSVIGLHRPD